MPAPTTQQARLHVEAVRDWPPRDQVVVRTFRFEGFLESIDLVNWIARKAQEMDQHPDIEIGSDAVTLKLTTHDEGGLTAKDFALARQCDEVFSRYFLL